jgi:hypothetical protein
MYENFSNALSPIVTSSLSQKQQIKILTDWLNEVVNIIISTTYPHSHQQMFQNMDFREYDNEIVIDSDNSMASCFILPKKRIWCIYKEATGVGVLLDNSTMISFSTFKCKPDLWYRKQMNKNWDEGRMWIYE